MKIKLKDKLLIFTLSLLLYPTISYSKTNFSKYDRNHGKWSDLVTYIITPTEKNAFESLKLEKDKNSFIQLFWKQRDPTRGTDINEYKDKIIKRFEYVNKLFGRGTPRKGWQTDMGRMYITLGEPHKIESFDHINGLYPAKVWDYYGLNIRSVPKNLTITFFKRNGFGEYVLYDPSADGPASLLDSIDTSFGKHDNRQIYKKIKKLAPQLVEPAFSVVPGRNNIMITQVQNSLVLSKIFDSPKKIVNENYAKDFLKFKGIVNVNQNLNIIKNSFIYTIIKDPKIDIFFLHFSIKPKKLSFEHSIEYNKYFSSLDLNVILKQKNTIISKYNKKFPLSFNEDEFTSSVKQMGVSIDDMFPIINGDFTLSIYLKNSVNNEFIFIKKNIKVNYKKKTPSFTEPFLGYRIKKADKPINRPFQFNNKIISVDSDNVFSLKDKIHLIIPTANTESLSNGALNVTVKSIDGMRNKKYSKTYTFDSKSIKEKENIIIDLNNDLYPAFFTVKSVLSVNNIPVKTSTLNFTISPKSYANHPIEMMDGIKYKDRGLFYYKTANLYRNVKKLKLADLYYKKGYQESPKLYNGLKYYLDFLILLNKPEKASQIIESIKDVKDLKFEYNLYKGKIQFLSKNYKEALKFFNTSNKLYDRDCNLLNLTGICYLKLSNIDNAKNFFSKSLKINPEQPLIKKYIKELNK